MSQSQPPPMSEDLLYLVAENILFNKPINKGAKDLITQCGEMDLIHPNAYTNFMLTNPTTFKVFMAHFVKMKTIMFRKQYFNEPQDYMIELYKKEQTDRAPNKSSEFQGPYLVNKGFVGKLVENKKLFVRTLISQNFLSEQAPKIESVNTPMQMFCALFLGKDLDAVTKLELPLALNKLAVRDSLQNISNLLKSHHSQLTLSDANIVQLLALNPIEVAIDQEHDFGHSDESKKLLIIDCTDLKCIIPSDRIEKIHYSFVPNFAACSNENLDRLLSRWRKSIDFFFDACPNLKLLQFKSHYYYEDFDIDDLLLNLQRVLGTLTGDILPKLVVGNSEAQIQTEIEVQTYLDIYEDIPFGTHELFKMRQVEVGEEEESNNPYTKYRCEVIDASGRRHTCVLVFNGEPRSMSDLDSNGHEFYANSFDDDYYDNGEDYDDYDPEDWPED